MKKTLATLVLSTIVLGGLATAASAETVSTPTTTGDIEFQADPDPGTVPPTPNPDPTDPDPDPENPEEVPGVNGPLRFLRVPDISFGRNNLKSVKTTYYAQYDNDVYDASAGTKGTYATFFTVEDVRGGTQGWTVSAANNGVFTSPAGHTISGYISFDGAQANLASGTFTKADNPTMFPTVTSGDILISTATSESKQLLSAKAGTNGTGQGYGVWSLGYGDDNDAVEVSYKDASGTTITENRNTAVSIEIPSQMINTGEVYSTDVIWTLGNLK